MHGRAGGKQTLVYDVKDKRLTKKQKWFGPTVVRVERKLSNLNVKLSSLAKLKNPFSAVSLINGLPPPPPSAKQKDEKKDMRLWSVFGDSVQVRGLECAIMLVPEDRRAKYGRISRSTLIRHGTRAPSGRSGPRQSQSPSFQVPVTRLRNRESTLCRSVSGNIPFTQLGRFSCDLEHKTVAPDYWSSGTGCLRGIGLWVRAHNRQLQIGAEA